MSVQYTGRTFRLYANRWRTTLFIGLTPHYFCTWTLGVVPSAFALAGWAIIDPFSALFYGIVPVTFLTVACAAFEAFEYQRRITRCEQKLSGYTGKQARASQP